MLMEKNRLRNEYGYAEIREAYMKTKISPIIISAYIAALILICCAGLMISYDQYSINVDATNCRACHGDIAAKVYISPKGENWGKNLHEYLANVVTGGDCFTCHRTTGNFPVRTMFSAGGSGLPPISCLGCHGRNEGVSGITATGLRQHMFRSGQTICGNCHVDADPNSGIIPVGETTFPAYYGSPSHPAMPTNPCNPPPGYNENFSPITLGLDNDGDLVYDMLDSECAAITSAGRIPNTLMVAKSAGNPELSWTAPGGSCVVSSYGVYRGALPWASYDHASLSCTVGGTTYTDASATDNYYYLVVPANHNSEGSYGTDSFGAQIPQAATPCIIQDLTVCY